MRPPVLPTTRATPSVPAPPTPTPSWRLSRRFCQPVDPPLKVIRSCLSLNSQPASVCSQWADRIGYSVSFLYLEPHHRNLLVPKNCLLALSQRAAVSISTIRFSSACWNSGLYRVALPSLSLAAPQQEGVLFLLAAWLPLPLCCGGCALPAFTVSPQTSLGLQLLPLRGSMSSCPPERSSDRLPGL